MAKDTLFLVGFFKFAKDPGFGFERIHLHAIFKTEEEARQKLSFCDEAGWYEGALLEERAYGPNFNSIGLKRVWLIQQDDGSMKEIEEPLDYKQVFCLIG